MNIFHKDIFFLIIWEDKMSKKNIFVFPLDNGDWKITREAVERASSIHNTQQEAWEKAQQIERKDNVEAFLTNKQGKIRERNTYGKDPLKSKG
jgi:hypothetical protein